MAFHYTTSIEKPDGIFHIRLYSINDPVLPGGAYADPLVPGGFNGPGAIDPSIIDTNLTAHPGMPAHMAYLDKYTKEIRFDPHLIPSGGIGKISQSFEDPLFRTNEEFQNFQLVLAADPVFGQFMHEARLGGTSTKAKDRTSIWCEITLEQYTEDLPSPVPAFSMFYPRKERLYFWGRLLPQETKGHVKFQELNSQSVKDPDTDFPTNTFVANQSALAHYGSITLTFVHWFKVACAQDPRTFLDHVWNTYKAGKYLRWGNLLDEMMAWIQPTYFHASSDQRYDPSNTNPGCHFLLSVSFEGSLPNQWAYIGPFGNGHYTVGATILSTNDIHYIGIRIVDSNLGVNRGVLFNLDLDARGNPTGNNGSYSLYNFKSFGDLFVAFCEEMQFKAQVELPTMKESVYSAISSGFGPNQQPPDIPSLWQSDWAACSRWLFFDARTPKIEFGGTNPTQCPQFVEFAAVADKVDYIPRPSWLGKFDFSDASSDKFGDGASAYDYGHHIIFGASAEGAIDISIKTLFSFIDVGAGFTETFGVNGPLGTEIYLFDDLGNIAFARKETFWIPDGTEQIISSPIYGNYIAFAFAGLWGTWNPGGTSIIEVDVFGLGFELFGDAAGLAPFALQVYKNLDFGEFPMFRQFFSNIGILLDPKTETDFRIFSIERTPGEKMKGTTHIKAFLKGNAGIMPTPVIKDDGPPERRIKTPPPFSGSPICGLLTVVFCLFDEGDCVTKIDITLDGQPYGTVGNFPNPIPPGCLAITVNIDTTILANGGHVVCLTMTCCDGTVVGPVCWAFIVQNPCVGPVTHYWSA